MDPQTPKPADQPVAYDNQGRPLYLRPEPGMPPPAPDDVSISPPGSPNPEELQVVQVTRSSDPVAVTIPPEIQARHEAARAKYPHLNLSAGEYVILDIRRHPIGLVAIWASTLLLAVIIVSVWWFLLSHPGSHTPIVPVASAGPVSLFTLGLLALVGLFGWIAAVVYRGNIFILTNESIIQKVQNSLISQQEKTVNLENIKDAQYRQAGFLQYIIGYGSIEITTEGDQENYSFTLVASPKEQIAIINNVIEAVKYGRPVEDAVKAAIS